MSTASTHPPAPPSQLSHPNQTTSSITSQFHQATGSSEAIYTSDIGMARQLMSNKAPETTPPINAIHSYVNEYMCEWMMVNHTKKIKQKNLQKIE
jgi:quinolinate synthase